MTDDDVILREFALIAITAGGAYPLAEIIASTVLTGLTILDSLTMTVGGFGVFSLTRARCCSDSTLSPAQPSSSPG